MAEPMRAKLDSWYASNRFASEKGEVKLLEAFLRYDRNPYIKDSNPEVSDSTTPSIRGANNLYKFVNSLHKLCVVMLPLIHAYL